MIESDDFVRAESILIRLGKELRWNKTIFFYDLAGWHVQEVRSGDRSEHGITRRLTDLFISHLSSASKGRQARIRLRPKSSTEDGLRIWQKALKHYGGSEAISWYVWRQSCDKQQGSSS